MAGLLAHRPPIDAEIVIAIALREFGVDRNDLISIRRPAHLVKARAFVVWALRTLGRARSYPEIACILSAGRPQDARDHSGVINLHQKAIALRLGDNHFADACRRLAHHYADTTTPCAAPRRTLP